MTKKLRMIIAITVIGTAVGGVYVWRTKTMRADRPSYTTVEVSRGDLVLSVQATGTVQPENRLTIKPPINGRIDKALVKEGDKVKKGQIIAQMSSTDRAALLDVARGKGPEEVAHWEEIYRPTPIIAPVTGVIVTRNVEPGQAVSTADTVYSLSDRLIVNAQVDETDMAKISLGQTVLFTLDAYPEDKITGKVLTVAFEARTVNNVTVYDVRILPDNPPAFMRSGMTASVLFTLAERRGVVLIPDAAVKRDGHLTTVLKANPSGVSPETPPVAAEIKVGLSDGKSIEVTEGLKEGESILQETIKIPEAKEGGGLFSPMGGSKKNMRGSKGR